MGKPHKGRMAPSVCFECRKSFKRIQHPRVFDGAVAKDDPEVYQRVCPSCGGVAHWMYEKFKPPKATDLKQWKKVKYLFDNGYRFFSVENHDLGYVGYPRTLAEAKQFVEYFKSRQERQARDEREVNIRRRTTLSRSAKR